MSFPKYPEYKDSGLECLGEVPTHWDVKQLRHCLQDSCGLKIGPFGSQLTSDMLLPEGFKVYGQENVIAKDFVRGERFISSDKFSEMGVYKIEEGDILVTMMGSSGRCAVVPKNIEAGIMDSHLLRIKINEKAFENYVAILLSESNYVQYQFQCLGKGSIMHGLNSSIIKQVIVAQPPLPEQSAIVAFLDRETAKIDALVAEQEKLIELLKEKRQAVISHAVTKGLDPNVPMKDSGVEWLGEVPEHWRICRVKHACSHVVDCLHTTPTYEGEVEFPAIRTADVARGNLLLEQARLVSREIYEERIQRLKPKAGDILYSREGERFGMAALVPHGVELCLGQRMMMFRTQDFASSDYLMWSLNSDSIYKQVLEKVGGSTSPHVNISDIVNFYVPLPPENEQAEIARHINGVVAELDPLIVEATRTIDLLKERRSALISAAVTGKIDVRGLAEATQ